MQEEMYLIESMEHSYGEIKTWWGPREIGYTRDINNAGRYTKERAAEICEKAGPVNEKMWKESEVLNQSMRVVLVQ